MTVRPVVIFGDPVLHRPTRVVTAFDSGLAALVEDLFDTMAAANGVGLAANQIGVGRRVFVYDCPTHRGDPGPNHRGVVVNPVLTVAPRREWETADEPEDEGCLSVPGESFALLRSPWARVRGQDPTGRTLSVAGTDLFARCLQHEIDHLDGLVYLDRLARRENRLARKAVRANGWGGPGLEWLPGVDRDPFGHDDVEEVGEESTAGAPAADPPRSPGGPDGHTPGGHTPDEHTPDGDTRAVGSHDLRSRGGPLGRVAVPDTAR